MKQVRKKTRRTLIAVVLSFAMLLSGIHIGNVKQEAIAAEAAADELPADILDYQYTEDICLQIPCEERNGIYFLNDNVLSLYDMDTKKSTLVHTFEHTVTSGRMGAEACYVAGNVLYVLVRSNRGGNMPEIQCYDLAGQSVQRTVPAPAEFCNTVGVDAKGRIYTSDSDYIYLLGSDGNVLSQAATGYRIFNIAGFDNTNGNFYVESYANWVYWGYDHDMNVLRVGNVSDGKITIDTDYNVMLGQRYYSDRARQLEVADGRYILADSGLYSTLYVFDSQKYTPSSEGQTVDFSLVPKVDNALLQIGRTNRDKENQFDRTAAVGTRTVYMPETDSLVSYVDGTSMAEYDLRTKKVVTEVTASHPIFSLMRYGDYVVAIEREDNGFYIEKFLWKKAGKIAITNQQNVLKVGESMVCDVESDGVLDETYIWSTTDSKVASVSRDGKVTACKEGTAVITVKTNSGVSASMELTVVANQGIEAPSENAIHLSGKVTENVSANNYTVWSNVMNSYLAENADGTLTRIEYTDKALLLETYAKDSGSVIGRASLPAELELFGGFYAGEKYNYVVFGSRNLTDSDDVEVMRAVKYSKSWERLSALSWKGCNTYIPFDAGSLRMTEGNGKLYIHTCHEMYLSGDGLHHQANMTFVVNEESMSEEQSYYDVMNIAQAGYVSHSFNQFVRTDGKMVYRVDHGDANPRGISITACKSDGDITKVGYTIPIPLNRVTGSHYNKTGASVGGFELSADNCLIAGNSVDFGRDSSDSDMRNVFVSVTGKNLDGNSLKWLTDYTKGSKITVRTPQLVKISDEQFLALWEEKNTGDGTVRTAMVTLDGAGNATSEVVRTNCRLSDCQPIHCSDGIVRWYVSDGKACTMYQVHPLLLGQINVPAESVPTEAPSPSPTVKPSPTPTAKPSPTPTVAPTAKPTVSPTETPTAVPAETLPPVIKETPEPSLEPEETPTAKPYETPEPSVRPDTEKDKENNSTIKLKKGSKVTDKKTKAVYKITGTGKNRTAEYIKSTKKNLVSVSIPASVKMQGKTYKITSVGRGAFKNNKKLKTVRTGINVKKIGKQAFSGCTKLTDVALGKNVSSIEADVFNKCTALTLITIPSKVTKIGDRAFYQCKNLRYILVKTKKLNAKSVGNNAFGKGAVNLRVKTDKTKWKLYSKIFITKGMSKKALFIIDPVKLIV